MIKKYEVLLFEWIVVRWMIQGGHQGRITTMYRIIRNAFEKEFTEDNRMTGDQFLAECFNDSQLTEDYKVNLEVKND